jgi:hypothetical protein
MVQFLAVLALAESISGIAFAQTAVFGRIHGTPGYPLTAVAGITMRFGGK